MILCSRAEPLRGLYLTFTHAPQRGGGGNARQGLGEKKMTVPEEIMRGNNKINEKKVKRVEKIK